MRTVLNVYAPAASGPPGGVTLSVPTFVVGTGRCGSTMLSNMVREHPKILSISEFFSFVGDGFHCPQAFSGQPMDGRCFWEIVSGVGPLSSLNLRYRIPMDERLYPCDDPNARFSWETGVPAILQTCLPHLTKDHDALFDLLHDEVIEWPLASVGEHYGHLFGWLAAHFGKQLWIERSGGGLAMMKQFLIMFPDARFAHVVRDGRDVVLSMQKHMAFRVHLAIAALGQVLGVDPLHSSDRSQIDRVPAELRPFLPETFNGAALRTYDIPLELCAGLWTDWIARGQEALNLLPADRLLTLRYEDFLTDPKAQLDALTAFLGEEFVDEDWSTSCAATVRQPRSTWRDLPMDEARTLTEASRPGFELLREAGVEYEV
jgi:putative sulfotransferase